MDIPVIPMTPAEFEVMERPFGWKVEYAKGNAYLTPRSIGVTTTLNLTPSNTPQSHQLIPVSPDYRAQMITGYFATFADSVEFCGWQPEDIQASAEKDIRRFFDAERGEPLPASVIALAPDSNQLAGLALFIRKPPEMSAYMDLLYVLPAFQRQGIGKAMLHWGSDRLLESGFQTLSSAYHICNKDSQRWHHRHGFQDEYDWYYARMKFDWYRSEIARRKQIGLLEGLAELEQARDQWALRAEPDDV